MKKYSVILVLLVSLLFVTGIYASYYETGFQDWKQPDGMVITVGCKGDSYVYYHETPKGYRVLPSDDGWWYYAKLDAVGHLIPSKVRVGVDPVLESSYLLERSEQAFQELDDARMENARITFETGSGLRETVNLGVVLVSFADVRPGLYATDGLGYPDSCKKQDYEDYFFSLGSWTVDPKGNPVEGSLADYYDEISQGEFHFGPGSEIYNAADADGYPVWFQLADNKSVYQGRSISTILSELGLSSLPSAYDVLAVVYAGHKAGGELAPHASSGKYIVSEGDDNVVALRGIGPSVHEFGHTISLKHNGYLFGCPGCQGHLPYMYWEAMNIGNMNGNPPNSGMRIGTHPASMNPRQIVEIKNWVDYTLISESVTGMVFQYDNESTNYYKLQSPGTAYPDEFFILEMRLKEGFDSDTPTGPGRENIVYSDDVTGSQGGLLIWRRGETQGGTPNWYSTKADPWVVPADDVAPGIWENWNSFTTDPTHSDYVANYHESYNADPWPYVQGQSFNEFTSSYYTINGHDPHVVILNIRWDDVSKRVTADIGVNAYTGDLTSISTISSNMTLWGDVTFGGDVLVSPGVNLTILPGTEIIMPPAKEIIVEGNLIADAQYGDPITFRSTDPVDLNPPSTSVRWDGIKVQNGGTLDLNNVVVSNATRGVYAYYDGTVVVDNSTIEDCLYGCFAYYEDNIQFISSVINNTKYGIYARYSDILIFNNTINGNENGIGYGYRGIYAYQSHFYASDNDIMGHSKYGMYINKSNPVLSRNDISGGQYGLYITNYAIPDLTTSRLDDNSVNNYFHDISNFGVYIGSNSNAELGIYSQVYVGHPLPKYYGGFNYFNNITTDYDVFSYATTQTRAELNWWENNSPYVAGVYFPIDTYPRAEQILGINPPLAKPSSGTPNELESMYARAKNLETDSLYVEAIAVFDSVITTAPLDVISQNALIALERAYAFSDNGTGFLEHLNRYVNAYPDLYIGFLSQYFSAGELARQGDLEGALAGYQECLIIFENRQGSTEESAWMLFSMGQIYEAMAGLDEGLGKESSSSYLAKVSESYNQVLDRYTYSNAATAIREILGMDEPLPPADLLPETFALRAAYPNPFNPSTTIQYELPNTTDVTIQIYDLLGRNVWSHEESFKPAGYYSLEWNGVNQNGKQVASGVYLISFSTPEFRAVQKAVLIR